MKKFKKTLTLFLALTICASFCTLNGNAVWYEFEEDTMTILINPDESNAYAEVHITDWATVTNTTDLYAETRAYPGDYRALNFISVTVDTNLGVRFEDDSTVSDRVTLTAESGNYVSAYIDGSTFLSVEDHYEIISFTSSHRVWVKRYVRTDSNNWEVLTPQDFQDGNTIIIGLTS